MNSFNECLDYCLECHEEFTFCQCDFQEFDWPEDSAELQSELPETRPCPLLGDEEVKTKRPIK